MRRAGCALAVVGVLLGAASLAVFGSSIFRAIAAREALVSPLHQGETWSGEVTVDTAKFAQVAVRGLVRVNAPPALSQGFLIDRLARLSAVHPGLDLDLATDLRPVSLDRHRADIAVRLMRPRDGDFIAKPLGTMGFGFYGTPAICAAVEGGAAPVFVGFDEENADMPDATWLAQHFPRRRVAFRANNHMSQAIAARTGAGLALLPHYIGRQVPGLRECALTPTREAREMWLLIRGQDRKARAIRTVADHLQQVFEEERALFVP